METRLGTKNLSDGLPLSKLPLRDGNYWKEIPVEDRRGLSKLPLRDGNGLLGRTSSRALSFRNFL